MSYIISLNVFLSFILTSVCGDTYSVKIETENHVNSIDSRFLSFTIDPKYLFSSSEKYRSKECICMASSLSPAFIRIAGPSTAFLSFHNATITIDDLGPDDELGKVHFQDKFAEYMSAELREVEVDSMEAFESRFKRNHEKIEVNHKDWRKFVQWAKSAGFDLVFALNNEEKMASGMWDPNTALNILTVAEKAGIGDIYWQLGYECRNQSIEEYLNDLETLRVIIETFAPGRAGKWKVVGGDVTNCLQADSKSDFKDYVTLSNDMMDAILLNANSSTHELDRMSERDRLKLLKILSHSDTPLWLTEAPWSLGLDELSRAADWLTGLGHAARNGFSHHFRELGEEIYQPTLSFYMALLFKNLVGSKVLHVDMEPEQAILFAHCTSLRHKAVPGAVTLYGVNMDDEPARFSIKLEKREEGGDILQFILGHDNSGNIQVNGRPMFFEGDLKPVVKRVRPYKTLLLNLPARSFGFWVLANTKINACYDDENNKEDKEHVGADTLESDEKERFKTKRSLLGNDFEDYTLLSDVSVDLFDDSDTVEAINNKHLLDRITELDRDLNNVQELFKDETKGEKRLKRQTEDDGRLSNKIKKIRGRGLVMRKSRKLDPELKPKEKLKDLLQLKKRNITRRFRSDRHRFGSKLSQNKVTKRNPRTPKKQKIVAKSKPVKPTEKSVEIKEGESKVRRRRSVNKDEVELSKENEVDPKDVKLWKILRKINKQLKDLSVENDDYVHVDIKQEGFVSSSENKKGDGDNANETGFIKATVHNLVRVLSDLNKNLNRFWNGIHLLD